MADIKGRAREYLAEHSEYSEAFGQTFVAVDTLTAMVEFAEQETKDLEETINGLREQLALRYDLEDKIMELRAQIDRMKRHCNCKHRDSEGYCEVRRTYLVDLSYDGCDKWELED